jgi:uncharacterized protein (DUF2267 family)
MKRETSAKSDEVFQSKTNRPADADQAVGIVLQAIRDRLSVNELARFGSALPPSLRAEFYAEWNLDARDFPAAFEEDVSTRLAVAHLKVSASEAIKNTWARVREAIHEDNLEQILPLFPRSVDLPLSA